MPLLQLFIEVSCLLDHEPQDFGCTLSHLSLARWSYLLLRDERDETGWDLEFVLDGWLVVLERDPSDRDLELVLRFEHVVISQHRAKSQIEFIAEYFDLLGVEVIVVLLLLHCELKLSRADEEFAPEISDISPAVEAIMLTDNELVSRLILQILEEIHAQKPIQLN